MSGIQCLQHIDRFTATYLTDNNPIRSHTKRSLDQVTNRNRCRTFHVSHLCFKTHQIGNSLYLEFCIVFDRDQPLIRRNIIGQRTKKRRLSTSRSASNYHRISRPHKCCKKFGTFRWQTSKCDQLFHRDRCIGETPDCQDRSIERYRTDHRINSGSVVQSGIHNRH